MKTPMTDAIIKSLLELDKKPVEDNKLNQASIKLQLDIDNRKTKQKENLPDVC